MQVNSIGSKKANQMPLQELGQLDLDKDFEEKSDMDNLFELCFDQNNDSDALLLNA